MLIILLYIYSFNLCCICWSLASPPRASTLYVPVPSYQYAMDTGSRAVWYSILMTDIYYSGDMCQCGAAPVKTI